MSENDFSLDSTASRARKRMLPSVAEVARELASRSHADAASILTNARKVCAEELARIKNGQESAPLDELVARAEMLIDKERREANGIADSPILPPLDLGPAEPTPGSIEPFSETTGGLDLRWERETIPAGEVPPSRPPDLSFPFSDDDGTARPPDVAGEAPKGPEKPIVFDLEEAYMEPKPTVSPARTSSSSLAAQHVRRSSRPSLPILIAGAVVLLGGASYGAWKLFRPSSGPAPTPPPLAVRRQPPASPSTSAPPVSTPAPPVTVAAASAPAPPTSAAPSAPEPTKAAPTPAPQPPKAPATPVPEPAKAAPAPAAQPARALPTQVAAPGPKAPSRAMAVSGPPPAPRKESPPAPQSRAGSLVTPDWKGAPVYVLHFSSFVEKARAERHAALLAKEFSLPARAVAVDLGARGIWHRAVVGDFKTAEEALAFRGQLLSRQTPGVGLVYRMSSKE